MQYPSFWGRAELKTRPLLPQEIMRFSLPHPLQLPASASGQYVPVLPSFPLCWTREPNWRLSVSLLPWVPLVEMHPFPGAAGIARVFPQVPSHVSRVGLYRTPALKCQWRRHLRAAAHPFQADIPTLALVFTKAPLVATARNPPKGSLSTTSSPTAGQTLHQLTAGNAWAAFCSQAHRQSHRGGCHPGPQLCCHLCHGLRKKEASPRLQYLETTLNTQRQILKALELHFYPTSSFQQDWWASCWSAGVILSWSRSGRFRRCFFFPAKSDRGAQLHCSLCFLDLLMWQSI